MTPESEYVHSLRQACLRSDPQMLQQLLQFGMRLGVSASAPARSLPQLTGMDGFSLIQSAISANPTSNGMLQGRRMCVQMLLEAHAPPIMPGSEPGPDQFVALRMAIARGDSPLVGMLLNAGGKPTDETLYNTILTNAIETLAKHARNPKLEVQDLKQRLACTQLRGDGAAFCADVRAGAPAAPQLCMPAGLIQRV